MNPFEDPNYNKLKKEFPALEHMAKKMTERSGMNPPNEFPKKESLPENSKKKTVGWKSGLEYRLGRNDD